MKIYNKEWTLGEIRQMFKLERTGETDWTSARTVNRILEAMGIFLTCAEDAYWRRLKMEGTELWVLMGNSALEEIGRWKV